MDPYTQAVIAFCTMITAVAQAREAEFRLMTPEQYAQDRARLDKALELLGIDHLVVALEQLAKLHPA